jgi:hypothetical protein
MPAPAAQEIRLLGEAAGLTLAASYGELDTGVALGDEEAFRLVACLQRPPDAPPAPRAPAGSGPEPAHAPAR